MAGAVHAYQTVLSISPDGSGSLDSGNVAPTVVPVIELFVPEICVALSKRSLSNWADSVKSKLTSCSEVRSPSTWM